MAKKENQSYRLINADIAQNCFKAIEQAVADSRDTPHNVVVTIGIDDDKARSLAQNRLQRLWIKELSKQGDMTAEEYRAFCKLHFGIPILRNENEKFCKAYDEKVKWRSYQDKLMFMAEPFDFPVTRLMTVKQFKQYLDKIYIHFSSLGFVLTDPENLGVIYD